MKWIFGVLAMAILANADDDTISNVPVSTYPPPIINVLVGGRWNLSYWKGTSSFQGQLRGSCSFHQNDS